MNVDNPAPEAAALRPDSPSRHERGQTYAGIKPLLPGMRAVIFISAITVTIACVQLFVLSEQTEQFFAWTINPPLTAAFLGAAYGGAIALQYLSVRKQTWADARLAVPSVLVFTLLTLWLTLLHIDRFHLGSQFDALQQFFTWSWIIIYALVPIGMIVALWQQIRAPGGDPPRTHRLPSWMRATLVVVAAIMLLPGIALLVAPQDTAQVWPWMLTPLTGRAVGAWLVGLGISAAHAAVEDDFGRVGPTMAGLAVFAILELIAVARYLTLIDWQKPASLAYIALLVIVLPIGLYGWLNSRRVVAT